MSFAPPPACNLGERALAHRIDDWAGPHIRSGRFGGAKNPYLYREWNRTSIPRSSSTESGNTTDHALMPWWLNKLGCISAPTVS